MKNFLKNIKKFLQNLSWELINVLKKMKILFMQLIKKNKVLAFPFKDKISADSSQFKILSFVTISMLNKYELVEGSIDSETTVIDCGGFIGGFTMAAILKRKAKKYLC